MRVGVIAGLSAALCLSSCNRLNPAFDEVDDGSGSGTGDGGTEGEATGYGEIVNRIVERDSVVCGSRTDLAGFGELDANGRNVGFDIDFCRAIAAALLGDPEKVDFVALSGHTCYRGSFYLPLDLVDIFPNLIRSLSPSQRLCSSQCPYPIVDDCGEPVHCLNHPSIDDLINLHCPPTFFAGISPSFASLYTVALSSRK